MEAGSVPLVGLVVEVGPLELSNQWGACFMGECLNCGLWEV